MATPAQNDPPPLSDTAKQARGFLDFVNFTLPEQAGVFGFDPYVGSDLASLETWIRCSRDAQTRAALVNDVDASLTSFLHTNWTKKREWLDRPWPNFEGKSLKAVMIAGDLAELQRAAAFIKRRAGCP